MCDRIDFFTHHSIKHNMDFIEGINVYFNGRLTGSYGNSTNNWCVKKLFLTKTTIIESVNAKSRSVIEKLEFRLVDDSKPKLIEIGSDNDQKAEKIDAKKMEIFGFYGSFVGLSDGSNALNTFGLIFEGTLVELSLICVDLFKPFLSNLLKIGIFCFILL